MFQNFPNTVCTLVSLSPLSLSLSFPPPHLFVQGIVVKVLHKKLGDRFYRKKGVVEEVRDTFTGVVKMIETGDKIKIDQAHLETVIPAIGE